MNDFEKLTKLSQEAVQAALKSAESYHNSYAEPEHIILELLRQDDGIVPSVVRACGVQVKELQSLVEKRIESLPRVSGNAAKTNPSPAFVKVLQLAENEAK